MMLYRRWLLVIVLMITGCGGLAGGSYAGIFSLSPALSAPPLPTVAQRAAPPTPTGAAPTPVSTLLPTFTPVPTLTPTTTPAATVLSPTPTLEPSPTPDAYTAYSVPALRARPYGGGRLEVVRQLERNNSFSRFLVRYPSDGLQVYGFVNVPHGGVDLPVVVLLHGYVEPAQYEVMAYTTGYADALARAGYVVFHPNYRNHPPSDEGDNAFRAGYAIDVLNLLALLRDGGEMGEDAGIVDRLNPDRLYLFGHSMGGGIALRVAVVRPEWIRGAVLYGAMSGDEFRNYQRIFAWARARQESSGLFELAASDEQLAAISPLNFLADTRVPLSVHHGQADEVVPPEWSEELCERLGKVDYPIECRTYRHQRHLFAGESDRLFLRRVVEFFQTH